MIGSNQTGAETRGLHLHSMLAVTAGGLPLGVVGARFDAPPAKDGRSARREQDRPLDRGIPELCGAGPRPPEGPGGLRDGPGGGTRSRSTRRSKRTRTPRSWCAARRTGRWPLSMRPAPPARRNPCWRLCGGPGARRDDRLHRPADPAAEAEQAPGESRAPGAQRHAHGARPDGGTRAHEPQASGQAADPAAGGDGRGRARARRCGSDPRLLFTTLPADTLEDCGTVVSHYAQRWRIEDWHRILKSAAGSRSSRTARPSASPGPPPSIWSSHGAFT